MPAPGFDIREVTGGLPTRLWRDHRSERTAADGSGTRDASADGPKLAWHWAFFKLRPDKPVPHPNSRFYHLGLSQLAP